MIGIDSRLLKCTLPILFLLGVISQGGLVPAQSSQNIDDVIESNTIRSWNLQVDSTPSALYGDINIDVSGVSEIYVLNQTGMDDFESQPYGVTSLYIAFATFQDNGLNFWSPILQTGKYYLVVSNHDDDAIHVTGYWGADVEGPEISLGINQGSTVSGTVVITFGATDQLSDIDSVTLEIDGVIVKETTGISTTYEWDTTQETDGTYTITVRSQDMAQISNQRSTTVIVQNNIGPVLPGNDSNIGIILLIVGIGVVAIILVQIRASPHKASISSLDSATLKDWNIILETTENIIKQSDSSQIWDHKIIQALDVLVENGSLGLSFDEVRRSMKILKDSGVFRWHDDDTVSLLDDFQERKKQFISDIESF